MSKPAVFATLWVLQLASIYGIAQAPAPKPAAVVPEEPAPLLQLEAGGPTAYVTALAFSPDGKTLYAAGFDKVIRVWKLNEQNGQFVLDPWAYRVPIGPGQRGLINVLAVSADGSWLAASGLGVFRQAAGFSAPGRVVKASAQEPEMRKDQATIYLFDTKTHAVRVLRGHEGYVLRLAFAPALAGKPPLLVSAAKEPSKRAGEFVGRVCLWDVTRAAYRDDQGALVDPGALVSEWILNEKPNANVGLAIRHTGNRREQLRVAIAWSDGKLRVWDAEQRGQVRLPAAADGFPLMNNTAAWTSGSEILTGGVIQEDGSIKGRLQVWNDAPGREPEAGASRLLRLAEGDETVVPHALALFTDRPGGQATHAAVVALLQTKAGAQEYRLIPIELAGLKILDPLPLWPRGAGLPVLATSPDGGHLALAGQSDHAVFVYRIADVLRGENKKQTLRSFGTTMRSVAFLEKGKEQGLFLSERAPEKDGSPAGLTESDLVFDFARRRLTPDPAKQGWTLSSPALDGWQVNRVRKLPAAGNAEKVRWEFDWQGPEPRGQVTLDLSPTESVTGATLLPPSKVSPVPILAVASWDRDVSELTLRLIDAASNTPLRNFTGHTRPITCLAASRDGKLLASAAEDQTVCIWSLTDLQRIIGQHGALGVEFEPLRNSLVVARVKLGSSADGKLEPGDQVDGLFVMQGRKLRSFASAWEFEQALWELKPGMDVQLQIQRQGATQSVSIRIEQGVDERKPLLSLFVVQGERLKPREWIAWTPIGPYDSSSQKVERYLGWQFNPRQLEEPVKFAPADTYRNQFHEPKLLKPLLGLGDIRAALREINPPVPKPEMHMEIEAPGTGLRAEESPEQIVRSPVVSLRVKIAGPSLEQNQVESITWRLDGDRPQLLDLEKSSGQRLTEQLRVPADRRAHKIQVHLRTREAVPQEASAEMTLRYLPPPPRIEFDKEWLRQQLGQATNLRKVVRSASFTVQAQVVPAEPGQEVEASLQQNQKPPISQGLKIDHKATLEPGENTLTLRAWNKNALAGLEDDETEQQTLVLIYEKRVAPQILLQALEPGGVRAAHVAIEPGKVMTVNTSRLRVLGTVIPMDDLQRVEVRNAKGDLLPAAQLDKQGFAAELNLQPGEQEFRFQARTTDNQSAEVRLPVKYLPVLPGLTVTEPENNLTLREGKDEPMVAVKGLFTLPEEFQPFKVLIQVNDQQPVAVSFTERKAVPVEEPQTVAKARLQPGDNRIQVHVKNDWRASAPVERHIFYRRPPQILGKLKITPDKKKPFADLSARVQAPAGLPLMRIEVNERRYEPNDVASVVEDKERSTWEINVKRVGLQAGVNTLRLVVQNADGSDSKEETLTFQPVPAKPPEILISERQVVTSVPEYAIQFRVRSESRLAKVELGQGSEGLKAIDISGQKQNLLGMFEVEGKHTVALTPGASGNSFRLVAVNEDGEARDEVTVSYVPPVVGLVVSRPEEQVKSPALQLKGYVAFRSPQEARQNRYKLDRLRIYVNDFQQRAVVQTPLRLGSAKVEFFANIVLNQPTNRIQIECPADLPLEAGTKRDREEFTVRCLEPLKPATLHLMVVGIGVREPREQEKLVQQAFKALQADCDSSEGLCSPVFKRVLLYPSGVSQPGILGGTVARGQVDGLLRRIRHVIGEQGSPSDVVLVYWLGRGAEKENEKWYLPTYYSRPGKKLSETGMALADLLAADDPTPGARLLLLDVSHSSSEELPVSTLSTAHAAILQYQWSKPGTRIPGLLLALEKAALNRGTVSLEEFRKTADKLRSTYPDQPKLEHNLDPPPPLAGLVVSQKP